MPCYDVFCTLVQARHPARRQSPRGPVAIRQHSPNPVFCLVHLALRCKLSPYIFTPEPEKYVYTVRFYFNARCQRHRLALRVVCMLMATVP